MTNQRKDYILKQIEDVNWNLNYFSERIENEKIRKEIFERELSLILEKEAKNELEQSTTTSNG